MPGRKKKRHSGDQLTKEKIEATLTEAYNLFKNDKEGKNADYIKELANVDPNIFGIALVTTDGTGLYKRRYNFNGIYSKCFKSFYYG